jgi:hypothetical protein
MTDPLRDDAEATRAVHTQCTEVSPWHITADDVRGQISSSELVSKVSPQVDERLNRMYKACHGAAGR